MLRQILILMIACGSMATFPARAQDIADPSQGSREILVRKYLNAIEFDKLMDAMTASMVDAQLAAIPNGSAIDASFVEAVGEVTTEVMRELRPEMMDRYVTLYAEVLTTEELMALVRFYESPTGHSITSKTQVLAQRSGPIMQEMLPRMQSLMLQRLCGRVKCPEGLAAQGQ